MIEQKRIYNAEHMKIFAILAANEPKLQNSESALSKDFKGSNAKRICANDALTEAAICMNNIFRPIWARTAPDSLDKYDEYYQNELALAKANDLAVSVEKRKEINSRYIVNLRQVSADWRTSAMADIRRANYNDSVRRDQAIELITAIFSIAADVANGYAQAKGYNSYQPPQFIPSAPVAPVAPSTLNRIDPCANMACPQAAAPKTKYIPVSPGDPANAGLTPNGYSTR